MGKLSEILKSLTNKIKSLSVKSKIALSIIVIGVIAAIIFSFSYARSNKYGVLFQNLSSEDGQIVVAKLEEKKLEMQVKGNAIYVPKEMVDSLRLELATSLTSGSKGYELLDSGNSFGMTDEEFKIKKQRAIQGELERTIKSFPQIENARVHLTLPQESPFIKDVKPGKASVYLQLKNGAKLNNDQVKSIIALIAGGSGIQNIPKENIEIMDNNLTLLSQNVLDENNNNSIYSSTEKNQQIEKVFEENLERSVLKLLEPAIGTGKVKVTVNADLDFDAKEKTQIVYDPSKVEVSTHIVKETNTTGEERAAQSPVDNNMNATITNGNTTNGSSTREESTINYANGETKQTTISAPGEVKRLTTSVIIDGQIDDATRNQIQRSVATAVGYKADRGDDISILGMTFNKAANDSVQAQFDAMKQEELQAQRMALIKNSAIGGGAFLGLLILSIALLRRFKKKDKAKADTKGLDVVISDTIAAKEYEKVEFDPIDFEANDEKHHLEKEIKKYATDKPEQVVDIIKSWLTEGER